MTSRPLSVLLVSEDRPLLRRLWRFLNASGYDVHTVADPQQAAAAWEPGSWDFLIVDAERSRAEAMKMIRQATDGGLAGNACYTFLLTSRLRPDHCAEALEAGADDFLARPVVYGELLARLRAGARELELGRRLREQIGVELETGLPNAAAFEGRLKTELLVQEGEERQAGCVLLAIDLFVWLRRRHGQIAANRIACAVARTLSTLCPKAAMLASFSEGRFAFLLSGSSDAEAAAWADCLRGKLSEEEHACGEHARRLTCSAGVAAVHAGAGRTAADILQEAREALLVATTSGGDRVVRFSELADDAKAWADFTAPGRLWDRTVARDVMTSCVLALRASDPASRAAELFRRTRLEAIPVVDNQGRLVGLLTDRQVVVDVNDEEDAPVAVGDVMLADVPAYEEETSFATLRGFFQRGTGSQVVITRDQRPVGTVNLNNLAALGSKLTADSFLPAGPFSQAGQYLIVPDLCPAEEEPSLPNRG